MKYDVVIVGAGIAGLYCAINLNPKLKVLLLSKSDLLTSNTALAQGGIAFSFDSEHYEDTLKAGNYTNNRENLRVMIDESVTDYERLLDLGVKFEADFGLEGGHSKRRIAHCKDSTGVEIVTALLRKVKSLPNVDLLEHTDFFTKRHAEDVVPYALVLATGGIGQVYNHTTNSVIATGDGIAYAHFLGAKISRMDLIQFHPTAFMNGRLLITEAVRGEGGRLLNSNFERFTDELQPRDKVSKAIIAQKGEVYIDISHKPADYIISRFPMIYSKLPEYGYDLTKQPIPVYPCQHYLMGGIDTDSYGRTSLAGLYAVGECAYTGVHGDNRLASNSLLESLVFSRRTAMSINNEQLIINNAQLPKSCVMPDNVISEIKNIMQESYFVVPNYDKCRANLARIEEIKEKYNSPLATVAYLILTEVLSNAL